MDGVLLLKGREVDGVTRSYSSNVILEDVCISYCDERRYDDAKELVERVIFEKVAKAEYKSKEDRAKEILSYASYWTSKFISWGNLSGNTQHASSGIELLKKALAEKGVKSLLSDKTADREELYQVVESTVYRFYGFEKTWPIDIPGLDLDMKVKLNAELHETIFDMYIMGKNYEGAKSFARSINTRYLEDKADNLISSSNKNDHNPNKQA